MSCYFFAIVGDDYVIDCIVIGVHHATEGKRKSIQIV